jgi:hypothetical protein
LVVVGFKKIACHHFFKMRQMGLCPPIELAPIPNPVIAQVPEEEEEEEVADTDIEVRELTEGRQNLLVPPSR